MKLEGSVGLFGGTFNPVHNAHLLVAETAWAQYALSEVVFIPNGIPPHKQELMGIDKENRYEMVRRSVAGRTHFSVSRIEIDREGPSYTIDTIRALADDCPQGVCFIIGADRLLEIETWKEPEALLRSVPFLLAPRAGIALSAFRAPPFDAASIHPLEMEEVDLSSTHLREMVRRGEPIAEWVPAAVAKYVEEQGLYRELTKVRDSGR